MLSDRPYRPGLPLDRVVRYIADQAGQGFDPQVAAAFLRITGDVQNEVQTGAAAALRRRAYFRTNSCNRGKTKLPAASSTTLTWQV